MCRVVVPFDIVARFFCFVFVFVFCDLRLCVCRSPARSLALASALVRRAIPCGSVCDFEMNTRWEGVNIKTKTINYYLLEL